MKPRYKLGTLLLALAILPPVAGWAYLNADIALPLGIWFGVAYLVIMLVTRNQR